ncbi:ATP-dependent acyl-CoA ligase [Verticiella sediminum]|uniref:ATP-dependent acyl-CoA ligase n=1 Tax=Verticiella sediminum TaxID=1247510 RepID=A0A556AWU1_9BURK|nr:ATP-dependent acyl-CoA ligase [Verticiella sediminum]
MTFVEIDEAGTERLEYRGYRELWQNGQALARALQASGMHKGERLALMMQNHPEYVEAMVACAILGLVFVPIDARTMGSKLTYMLNAVQCKGVVAAAYCASQLADISKDIPDVRFIWFLGPPETGLPFRQETALVSDRLDNAAAELDLAVDDPRTTMQLMFTSGTTGDPKAIVGTYERYAASCSRRAAFFGIRSSDRMYTGLSLTHANALNISLGVSLYSNIPLVISQRFTKSRLWDIVRRHECTTLNLLGGMFTAIHAEPVTPHDADNPLRLIIGAGMPKELWRDFETRFGVEILEFYGAAEGGLIINLPGTGPVGSIGKPAAQYDVRILDEDGNECPPGEPGEIVFGNADGSPIQLAYFNDPEASAKKAKDGLLWMGDIGYRDAEGWLYFLHRKGGEIRRNGDFISRAVIEKELGAHPNVKDVFVYGIPSANGVAGEKDVVAAIALFDESLLDGQEIQAYCAARMEKNHIPAYLQIVPAIPKTASEKPLERILSQAFSKSSPNVLSLQS